MGGFCLVIMLCVHNEFMKEMKEEVKELFQKQKRFFRKEMRSQGIADRRRKLKAMRTWIRQHEEEIVKAVHSDFKKPAEEIRLSEIKPVLLEIDDALVNLRNWAESASVNTPMFLMGTRSKVVYEPKGVTLIIAPWNYPFNLCIGPLVSAIAAGNTVVLKPSEMTPGSEQLIQRMIDELFQEDEVAVVTGGADVGAALLELPWNHIFFTGSPTVGKIVMRAAAEHLSSVTLELGGQNPAIVDETASLKDTAEKLIWGKYFNCGQTCISPNYVLVHATQYESFKQALKMAYEKLYGKEEIQQNPDYPRIVNQKHFQRIKNLLDDSVANGATVFLGGETHAETNFISPTILENITTETAAFKAEIFGPIMLLMKYEDIEQCIDIINNQPPALALYIFSKSDKKANHIIQHTQAGTTVVNDTTLQFSHPNLPFGGHNNSGIGKAHGHYGFLEFSNQRAVMKQRRGMTGAKLIYPPYTPAKKKAVQLITWKM